MTNPAIIEIAATESFEAAAAKITPQADVVLLLFGEVDQAFGAQVRSVFERAVAPVALLANALVIDDGRVNGIAGLLGQAAKQLDQSPFLLGILSPNESAPDSNHSALMQLPREWDDVAKSS